MPPMPVPALCVILLVGSLAACGDDQDDEVRDTPEADVTLPEDTLPEDTSATDSTPSEVASWDPLATPWPMFGGDPQRRGRSPFVGPARIDEAASWRYDAVAAGSINMQPTITAAGVFFGSWGIFRGAATTDPATSRKSDGHYYGLDPSGAELFAPFDPAPLPACYAYPSEPISAMDRTWCGADAELHVTFYNGTIEGSALVDPWSGLHYVGRGDGALYAIDPVAGRVVWRFSTFDPTDPDHPDGGGEIVGGALMGPDGTIYFATFGVPFPGSAESPQRETQAVYAIDRRGELLWRYPSASASLDNTVTAALALSPDGRTLYAGTWLSDPRVHGRLIAFDLAAPAAASDEARTRWSLALANASRPGAPKIWARHLTVGDDGTIFVAGAESRPFGYAPVVVAVSPAGAITWVAEPHGYDAPTTLVQGLALGDGVLFAATGDTRNSNGHEALLAALDPASGAVLGTFDPGDDAVGSMTGPLVDVAGQVFVGTRGRHDLIAAPFSANSQWRRGTMFALAWDAPTRRFTELWRREIDHLLDWATPALDARGVLYFGSTAPLPIDTPQTIWEPLEGTPPRTSTWFYALSP